MLYHVDLSYPNSHYTTDLFTWKDDLFKLRIGLFCNLQAQVSLKAVLKLLQWLTIFSQMVEHVPKFYVTKFLAKKLQSHCICLKPAIWFPVVVMALEHNSFVK